MIPSRVELDISMLKVYLSKKDTNEVSHHFSSDCLYMGLWRPREIPWGFAFSAEKNDAWKLFSDTSSVMGMTKFIQKVHSFSLPFLQFNLI